MNERLTNIIEEIKARLSLVEFASKYTKLIRSGSHWKGLCVFHKEKTSSFFVTKDRYHCFGCGAKGSIIDFVMEKQKLSFVEAIKTLAEQANISIALVEQENNNTKLLEDACEYFRNNLHDINGQHAREYLFARNIEDSSILTFDIGYAPHKGLKEYLFNKGYSEKELINTGLINEYKTDIFRNRLIMPIKNKFGRTIAFAGRTLTNETPKYLNSKESNVFHKSNVLFGYHIAQRFDIVTLVEGYIDVIALYQKNIGAVASMGTALSETQLKQLWALNKTPIIMFDGDDAGSNACYRICKMSLPHMSPDKFLKFFMLQDGQDPFDLCQSDNNLLEKIVEESVPASAIIAIREMHILYSPEDRALAKNQINEIVKLISDNIVKTEYQRYFDNILNKTKQTKILSKKPIDTTTTRIKVLLAMCIMHPFLIEHVIEDLTKINLQNKRLKKIKDILVTKCTCEKDVFMLSSEESVLLEALVMETKHHIVFLHKLQNTQDILDAWREVFSLHIKKGSINGIN